MFRKLHEDPVIQESYPSILQMYKVALLVPQSTAVVERGFSAMNDICTELRTLGQQCLDSLMRINLWQGDLNEQDFDNIVDIFKERKDRDMPL